MSLNKNSGAIKKRLLGDGLCSDDRHPVQGEKAECSRTFSDVHGNSMVGGWGWGENTEAESISFLM